MTEEDLIRRLDVTLERNAATFERQAAAFQRQELAFDTMTHAFQTFLRTHNRLEQKLDRSLGELRSEIRDGFNELRAEMVAIREAIFALIDRLEPPAAAGS